MIDILFCFALVLLTVLLYKKYRKQPPGPYGLPVVGYYPFLGEDPIESIDALSKSHGEIVSINLLGENFWILNSVDAIHEALVTKGDHFSGKSQTEYYLTALFAKNTFALSEGEEWRAQLKFILGHLSQLGMGKSHFEVTMHNLIDNLERYIESKNGEPHDYQAVLGNYVLNVMTTMVCSKQYKEDDPTYIMLMNETREFFSAFEYLNFILTGNIFKLLLKFKPRIERTILDSYKHYLKYSQDLVDERMKTFDENNCRDLLDYWIKESSGPHREYFRSEYIADNIAAMVQSAHSPSTFLYHALYEIAVNRSVQTKMFEEIGDTIGFDSDFCYLDRERLPYTQAVIAEVHRFHMLTAITNVHWNRGATKLRGYEVPKRQKVIANFYSLSRDPKHFKNPAQFDPNNFLDDDGNYKPNKASMPFGVGVRKCLGMKLAEVEVFLAFVRLVRKFEWIQTESTCANASSIRFLRPFKISAKRRE